MLLTKLATKWFLSGLIWLYHWALRVKSFTIREGGKPEERSYDQDNSEIPQSQKVISARTGSTALQSLRIKCSFVVIYLRRASTTCQKIKP